MNQGYHSDWVDRCDPDIRIPHSSQFSLMYLLLLLCSDITRRKDGPAHAASFLADIALRTSDYAGAVGRYVVDDQDELEATAVS